ncbi:DUF3616 domain-containing protein [Luteolibacter pohnpeiensis]|uniref:DUF3616 domain-containing protein n=1 Tax=Luteolibacter pohnpeiensis TaxID=454153 RepID=A0A934S4Y5_9BACT|nr:DUF3616 domain-containing protein [Luteolibacter pohnpeiensis]MBK1880831.1 DUF3616 domain-containing protein [Luteolibacter pohnpeiensis]
MKSLTLLIFAAGSLQAAPHRLEILDRNWKLDGFAESLDLSGIAAIGNRSALVGTDELFSVQPARIDFAKHVVHAKPLMPLLDTYSGSAPELDIEAIAADPENHRYFVTGSHGVGKKKADVQPPRETVFEVPVDPESGEILRSQIRRSSLLPWFQNDDLFQDFVRAPLQQNGINIEGLAFRDGKLWFGMRGPNIDGTCHIIEISSESLFSGDKTEGKSHEIQLGDDYGVRELTAVRDGFLIIAGNSAAEASKKIPVTLTNQPDDTFHLYFWKPGQKAEKIGQLPHSSGKAEAMLVLDDTPSHCDLLVIFDSAPEGGPIAIRVHR